MENENQGWLKVEPGSVCLEDGLLKWKQGKPEGIYDPFEEPNLLINAFARVKDAKSAINFMERYGPLGYNALAAKKVTGEPLEWVLGQADTVRFALSLIVGLESWRGIEYLRNVLRERQLPRYKSFMNMRDGVYGTYHIAVGAGLGPSTYRIRGLASYEDTIRQYARNVLAYLVSHNSGNVRRVLVSSEGELRLRHEFESLIEVVWYLVGDKALLSQEGRGYMAVCHECGTPFAASRKPAEGHPAFCPNEFWPEEKHSLCGLRYRIREKRAKERQTKKGGRNEQNGVTKRENKDSHQKNPTELSKLPRSRVK